MGDRSVEERLCVLQNDLKILKKNINNYIPTWKKMTQYFMPEKSPFRASKMEMQRLRMEWNTIKESLNDTEEMIDTKNLMKYYRGRINVIKEDLRRINGMLLKESI